MLNNKFHVDEGELVLTRTGEMLTNEPVFILRAADQTALQYLVAMKVVFPALSSRHMEIQNCITQFQKFQEENPNRIGSPEEVY